MLITDILSINELIKPDVKRIEVENMTFDDLKSLELTHDIKNPTLLELLTVYLGKPIPQGMSKNEGEFIHVSLFLSFEKSFEVKDAVKVKKISVVK